MNPEEICSLKDLIGAPFIGLESDTGRRNHHPINKKNAELQSSVNKPRILLPLFLLFQLHGVQHGALMVVDSTEQAKERITGDQKTLRRLVQNREAARKSRLRKKWYGDCQNYWVFDFIRIDF